MDSFPDHWCLNGLIPRPLVQKWPHSQTTCAKTASSQAIAQVFVSKKKKVGVAKKQKWVWPRNTRWV